MRLRKRPSGTYQVYYYDHTGKRRWKNTHCTDRRAAEIAGRRIEREAQDPDHAAASTVTLTEILEDMIDHREALATAGKRSPETVAMYRKKAGHLRRVFELDEYGDPAPMLVAGMVATDVDRYIEQRRSEGAAETTIAKELVTLRAALKLAKRAGKWAGDVSAILPIAFAPEYRPRERALSMREVRALLPHLTPDHAARVCFAISTSANWGETRRAMREDVGDVQVFIRGTKRTSRRRTVPIVADWQRQLIQYALDNARGLDGKLFRFDGGFHSALSKACIDAEIPHATSNDLRRTFAAWMRAAGVPAELVAPAMGHADTRMVERVYGRMTADVLAARMAIALGGTPVAQTYADSADDLDAPRRRRKKRGPGSGENGQGSAEGGGRTLTGNEGPGDFKSPALELPSPRARKRNSAVYDRVGTAVAQRNACTPPRRRRA